MCGIMGYVGKENAVEIILSGLEELEYRGYDSSGIAFENNNSFNIIKTVGSPIKLRSETESLFSTIGIGHTRWATHGAANETNAHPHKSSNGLFTIVHNGIIENYNELKDALIESGVQFNSETDTEVIAQLLENKYNGDFKGTVISVLPMLSGSYALGIVCSDYPDTLICAKKSSPLFVGTSDTGNYLSSDISAISRKSDRIFRLNDFEIGIITKDSFKVFDLDGCRIRKSEIKIKSQDNSTDKQGFEHYMLKEIYEQPDAIRRTLSEIIDGKKIRFRSLKWSKKEIKEINSVIFVACGSAYHAGLAGSYACEEFFKRTSKAETASEFRYKLPKIDKNTLVVIISQSGETADTLAALRIAKQKGAKIISIVNVENSTIALESDCVVLTKAGKEIAVATTKAYTAQLAVIYSLIIYLSVISEEMDKKKGAMLIDELKSLPNKIEAMLRDDEKHSEISDIILKSNYACFIGRNYDYCSSIEGSLKLKEISYIPCEAYPAGELKHGTISLIDTESVIIALNHSERLRDKITSNIKEVEARGGKVVTIAPEGISADINIPFTTDFLSPILSAIPLQLIAYHTAVKKGCEIDKPRNLAKSVTVE